MALSPIQLAVIQNGLKQVASEMDITQEKTSFSPVISEGRDRANGIYHRETGEVIAQGETGLPSFVGCMQFSTQAVIAARKDLEDGDIVLMNDPYLGGTHLMDVKLVTPFFYKNKLWCYLSNTGHWPDTGGMVPGGFTSTATEIQQEGLRIPPVKLYRRGVLDQDILALVLGNIRVPEERNGDLRAHIGALNVGARRLTELLDKYDADVVSEGIIELKARSEKLMRSYIASVPDGEYAATTYCDSDGVEHNKLVIRLTMTVRGEEIFFDLSGSSPPCKGPMNCPADLTKSSIYVAMKHIFPDVPINSGCFVPLRVERPVGTFLDATYPRPCAGAAGEVSQRIMEAVFIAMGQAIPDQMFASPFGTVGNLSLGGYDPKEKRQYVLYMFTGGGHGGWWEADGLSNACSTVGISKTTPLEIMEQHYPVIFDEYALRPDSGGPGRHRGGLGVSYRLRLLRGEATASFIMDHGTVGVPGLLGGGEGRCNEIEITQAGNTTEPPHVSKGSNYVLKPGDSLHVRSPGGGGYGIPSQRTSAAITRDLLRGYATREQLERDYETKQLP